MAEDKTADDELLETSRENLEERITEEKGQRDLMRDDLKFASLDQWPEDLRRQREGDVTNGARPCLTIDQSNQYITQVSNDMAKNRPSIKTRPVDDVADPETAKIFQGLIRHIEDRSNAAIAYDTAGDSAVKIGLGFVRVITDWVSPHQQEILITRIPDTFKVYLGSHIMPDGSDAAEGWIIEDMPIEKFKRLYPDAKSEKADFDVMPSSSLDHWRKEKTIRVCEYFYKEYSEPYNSVYLADGKTMKRPEYDALSEPRPQITGERDIEEFTVKWCKHTGLEVLEKTGWLGKYIPIAEVVGKEQIVEGKRHLWGLVRPAKDSLRAFNYWISAMVEKMALAPKAPWVGAVGQFATMSKQWDESNVVNHSRLEYDAIEVNGNVVAAPRRQEPVQMEVGMMQVLTIMQNNVKSSLGMYKASIGDTESQQSGRAILALQKESDTGTMHFGSNQALMICHVGRIIVDLAPKIYKKLEVLRILGEDGKAETVRMNPKQEKSVTGTGVNRIYNLNVGTYDVTVTVGPGYTTSRQEASTVMTELANSAKDPVTAAIMQYGAVKNADFAGSEEITRMLKAMLPPQVSTPDGQQPIPPQALQQMQQMQAQGQQMHEALQKLHEENMKLKSGALAAEVKINADHDVALKQLRLDAEVEDEKLRIARKKAEEEMQLKRDIAAAEHHIDEKNMAHDHKMTEHAASLEFAKELGGTPGEEGNVVTPLSQIMQGQNNHMDVMQAIVGIMQNQTVLQEQGLAVQKQTLEALLKPKTVSIAGVKKNASGDITGATVTQH